MRPPSISGFHPDYILDMEGTRRFLSENSKTQFPPIMKTSTKKIKKTVCVDAGLIWIGDPCYVLGDDASHRVHDWGEFCGKLDDNHASEPLGDGMGVAISSGYGDGAYEVELELSDEGVWGERVKKVTITFIGDAETRE